MRKGLGKVVYGSLLGSLALASLALLPSSAWAARDERKDDRSKDERQVQAQPNPRNRQTQDRRAVPGRANGRAGQPGVAAPAAPAPAGQATRPGRGNAVTPAGPQVRQSAPTRTRPQPRPSAPVPAPAQTWQAPTPSWEPQATPNQNPRQRERTVISPQTAPETRRVTRPAQAPDVRRPSPAPAQVRPDRTTRPRPAEPVATERNQPRPEPRQVERERAPAPIPTLVPAQPARPERRVTIPEARFRGAGSEERVHEIAPTERRAAPGQLKGWVREQNRQPSRVVVRPTVDVVGNRVPATAVYFERRTPSYRRISVSFGAPRYSYVFVPGAVWGNGLRAGAHHQHHTTVINCYYPFYYSDPGYIGFYYAGYYPSVYTYFGWAPGWIYPERVYYAPADYVYYVPAPHGGYRLDYRGANQAIEDVRRAWLEGDIDPLALHLTDQLDVRVYFEGKYSYTTATDDFYTMTLDTLATVQTIAMDFGDPIWISSHEVFYTGRQVFEDPDGMRDTIYVSFRFRKLGTEWYLVAVGTSQGPIQHQYTDFRYR